MLRIAICDDLPSDRLKIEKSINAYCHEEDYDIQIISFEKGEALIKHYGESQAAFDIIYLDIYMSGINGIKTAEKVRQYDLECKIIFTTSSPDHALDSFAVYPFNYLIKPISKTAFVSVLEKAIKEIDKENQKSLSIKIGSTMKTIYYKDLIFVASDAKLINIHTTQNMIFSFICKLDDIETQLNDKRFLRCHKSFLVNMDSIMRAEDYSFIMSDATRIPITQRYFPSIKKTFYNYIFDKANLKNKG